jgi:hypothetical protein
MKKYIAVALAIIAVAATALIAIPALAADSPVQTQPPTATGVQGAYGCTVSDAQGQLSCPVYGNQGTNTQGQVNCPMFDNQSTDTQRQAGCPMTNNQTSTGSSTSSGGPCH